VGGSLRSWRDGAHGGQTRLSGTSAEWISKLSGPRSSRAVSFHGRDFGRDFRIAMAEVSSVLDGFFADERAARLQQTMTVQSSIRTHVTAFAVKCSDENALLF